MYFTIFLIVILFGTPSHGFYCIPCPLTQPCTVPASCDGQYAQPQASPCPIQPAGTCPYQAGNFPPLNLVLKYDPKETQERERQPPSSGLPPRRFLTSLFSIPGAVADSIMSGEINI